MELRILLVYNRSEEWDRIDSFLSKRKGFHVSRVHSTADAVRALRSDDMGIVVADYSVPKGNPLNFVRKIKEKRPHIEVIFLSAPIALSKAIEALREGAYDFYEFPVNLRLLSTVIGKAAEKQALYYEMQELQQRVRERFEFANIIGRSKPMQHVMGLVASVAPKNVNILITGETGTGKELIANAIHYNSPRASKPFITVNCAAYNEGVLESELFGHEKGAFTGAIAQRIGRFELADGGTIFLDEIGDITPSTQIKLLRVLQEREFERVGGNETIKVDVRVIAATNRNLKENTRQGSFREDLYYRLNVVPLELPPLRERKGDIPLLVSYFINKLNSEKDYRIKGISKEAMRILLDYNWPGNVRELENVMESAMALTGGTTIEAKYLPSFMLLGAPEDSDFYLIPKNYSMAEAENELIRQMLVRTGGNKSQAAKLLGIGLRTLQRKAKAL